MPSLNIPLINGKAYDYADIVIAILGVPTPSISKISYKEKQDKKNNFGTGIRPVSRGRSYIDADGSIDISMNDVEALRTVAPNGSLLSIPMFDIVVIFGNGGNLHKHTLKNCEFLEDGTDTSAGDTDIKISYPIVLSHIVRE